jgi:hypothetical protein
MKPAGRARGCNDMGGEMPARTMLGKSCSRRSLASATPHGRHIDRKRLRFSPERPTQPTPHDNWTAHAPAPARLVMDPQAYFFWLSCETATANEAADRAVPVQSRRLVRVHASCIVSILVSRFSDSLGLFAPGAEGGGSVLKSPV